MLGGNFLIVQQRQKKKEKKKTNKYHCRQSLLSWSAAGVFCGTFASRRSRGRCSTVDALLAKHRVNALDPRVRALVPFRVFCKLNETSQRPAT